MESSSGIGTLVFLLIVAGILTTVVSGTFGHWVPLTLAIVIGSIVAGAIR